MLVNADGDGTPDRLLTRETASEPNRTAELELVLDSQRVVDVPLPLMNVDVAPIGGYDVDGDGRDELFVNTGQGAYTQYIDVLSSIRSRACWFAWPGLRRQQRARRPYL